MSCLPLGYFKSYFYLHKLHQPFTCPGIKSRSPVPSVYSLMAYRRNRYEKSVSVIFLKEACSCQSVNALTFHSEKKDNHSRILFPQVQLGKQSCH